MNLSLESPLPLSGPDVIGKRETLRLLKEDDFPEALPGKSVSRLLLLNAMAQCKRAKRAADYRSSSYIM